MSNQSLEVTEFFLHGLPETPELRIFHFIAFLFIYLMAVSENLLIISVIIFSPPLHKPMYYFLANLALQDVGSISAIVPKYMANSVMNTKSITYNGCLCQIFFLVFFTVSHLFLLGVMAYDRYIAICNPLHYETLICAKSCVYMTLGVWITGLLYSTVYMGSVFTIKFCSNDIDQFFCEISKFYKIACSDSYFTSFTILCVVASVTFIYFALIIYSYFQIFRVLFRIPSTQGRQKGFSTCLPHLTVIMFYTLCGSVAYLGPVSKSSSVMNIVVSMFYCMMPPVMNPFIYSIRNKELKIALWKLAARVFPQLFLKLRHSGFLSLQ